MRLKFWYLLFLFSFLVVFVPIENQRTTNTVDYQTRSISLAGDYLGIEFPAVRQQLYKVDMSFNNLCLSWNSEATGSRVLVSTSVKNKDGWVLEIVKVEERLLIFLGGESVFERVASELFEGNCNLRIVVQGPMLTLVTDSLSEYVQLVSEPKFSLLVVDKRLMQSGNFTSTMTTKTFGTQLSPIAVLARLVSLLLLLLLMLQSSNSQFSKKVNHA